MVQWKRFRFLTGKGFIMILWKRASPLITPKVKFPVHAASLFQRWFNGRAYEQGHVHAVSCTPWKSRKMDIWTCCLQLFNAWTMIGWTIGIWKSTPSMSYVHLEAGWRWNPAQRWYRSTSTVREASIYVPSFNIFMSCTGDPSPLQHLEALGDLINRSGLVGIVEEMPWSQELCAL